MISSLNQQAWDEKIIDLGGPILQSFAWGEFQQSLGYKIYRFSWDSFANLAIELPLPLGKKYIYCPKGPVGNAKDACDDLRQFSTDHTVIFARVEPQSFVDLPKAAKEVQPHLNWMLDIEKSEQDLLIGMKPKTRYNIHLAARKNVTVREGKKEDLIRLWELMLNTAARNKFRLHPQNYYWQMFEHLSPTHLKILLAEHEGRMLSGMLISFFGETATYLHGGSAVVMKDAMSPFLLHWTAIQLSKSMGCKFYDFGGIASSEDSSHAWAGISRFKKSFGGFEVENSGAFDLIFSPLWYNIYKQARLVRKLVN